MHNLCNFTADAKCDEGKMKYCTCFVNKKLCNLMAKALDASMTSWVQIWANHVYIRICIIGDVYNL